MKVAEWEISVDLPDVALSVFSLLDIHVEAACQCFLLFPVRIHTTALVPVACVLTGKEGLRQVLVVFPGPQSKWLNLSLPHNLTNFPGSLPSDA